MRPPTPVPDTADPAPSRQRRRAASGALWLAAAFVALVAAPSPVRLSPARADEVGDAGARIYGQGIGAHPVSARIAGGRVEVPGKLFPCANCHKADGLGVVEGGLRPRDVTWPKLTGPLDVGGRGYDTATLARAITEGTDAQDRPLGPGMPRYKLDPSDLDALLGYLRRLDEGAAPGVTGEAVRVATLLPLLGRMAGAARTVERFLDLAVLDINTRRRFDGRRILRLSVPFDPDVPGDALRAARAAVAADTPFAFLANLAVGPDDAAHAFLAGAGIPEIAPLAVPYEADDRSAIWVEPSVADQAHTLVDAALRSPAMPFAARASGRKVRLGLVWRDDPNGRTAAVASRAALARAGNAPVLDQAGLSDPAAVVTGLRRTNADAVLLFGSAADAAALASEAERAGWRPVLLGRSQQLDGIERDVTTQGLSTIFLVTSFGGVEPRSRGAYDFRRVAGELGGGHPELLRDAYVGAKLLEATLAGMGRKVTRPGFLAAVADTSGFATGVTAPLSFGPGASRRAAAVVMRLDPARRRLVPLEAGPPS